MKLSAWMGLVLLFTLAALGVCSVWLEMARPGKILCPLRRLCYDKDININDFLPDYLGEVSSTEEKWSEERAEEFQQQALARFSNLRVEKETAVPLGENGYWQLVQMEHQPIQPGNDLLDELPGARSSSRKSREFGEVDALRAALASNRPWVEHVKWIASLEATSNADLPESVPFFPYRYYQHATGTLLAKSLVEASEGREQDALQTMRLLRAFPRHVQNVEVPTLMVTSLWEYSRPPRWKC